MQTDPSGYGDGLNLYAYVHNDPVNGIDPTGLEGDPPTINCKPDGTDCESTEIVVTGHHPGFFSIIISTISSLPKFIYVSLPEQQNTQPSPSSNRAAACAALVAKNDLAGSALDAASIIPGGGDLADVARLGAGAASLGISVSQGNKIGTAIGATGTALGGVVVARNTVNAAAVGVKDGLEAVPGIGTVVGLGALAFDAYSAVDDYNKCMSGH